MTDPHPPLRNTNTGSVIHIVENDNHTASASKIIYCTEETARRMYGNSLTDKQENGATESHSTKPFQSSIDGENHEQVHLRATFRSRRQDA